MNRKRASAGGLKKERSVPLSSERYHLSHGCESLIKRKMFISNSNHRPVIIFHSISKTSAQLTPKCLWFLFSLSQHLKLSQSYTHAYCFPMCGYSCGLFSDPRKTPRNVWGGMVIRQRYQRWGHQGRTKIIGIQLFSSLPTGTTGITLPGCLP